jgi:hypothetical protein
MAETITQITQPPAFIEAESKLYLDQLRNAIGGLKGADLSKIMGPQFMAGHGSFNNNKLNRSGISWYRFLCNLTYKQLLQLLLVLQHIKQLYVSVSTRCNWIQL